MVCLNTKLKCSFATPLLILDKNNIFKYIIIKLYNLHIICYFFSVYNNVDYLVKLTI